jgi:hypothetical protein
MWFAIFLIIGFDNSLITSQIGIPFPTQQMCGQVAEQIVIRSMEQDSIGPKNIKHMRGYCIDLTDLVKTENI